MAIVSPLTSPRRRAPSVSSGAPMIIVAPLVCHLTLVAVMLTWMMPGVNGQTRVAMDVSAVAPLLAIKSALGVGLTVTDWGAGETCLVFAGSVPSGGGWTRIGCDGSGKPIRLNLPSMKLSATLPKAITLLTSLTYLNLYNNLFNHELSTFTSDIVTMKNLKYVDFSSNRFYGSFPATLLQMTSLTQLVMNAIRLNNRLANFTSDIVKMKNLKRISLMQNYLYGPIPAALLSMTSLTELLLNRNYLTGTVPPIEAPLKILSVDYNFLTGTFPTPKQPITTCNSASNCFVGVEHCEPSATMQADSACAVCGKPKGTASPCGSGGVCKAMAKESAMFWSDISMACEGGSNGDGGKKRPCTKKCSPCRISYCRALTCVPFIYNCDGYKCVIKKK